MQMVRHTTEGMYPMPKTGDPFLEQLIEVRVVLVAEEDDLSAVAAEHDMVHRTRKMDSWFARHGSQDSA
jgi:hypothetical protein